MSGMSPKVNVRRTTRALYMGHGVVVGRVEHERRLFRGMRDNHAYVVPERGSWEFLYRGTTYRQHVGLLQLKQPGELLREGGHVRFSEHRVVISGHFVHFDFARQPHPAVLRIGNKRGVSFSSVK